MVLIMVRFFSQPGLSSFEVLLNPLQVNEGTPILRRFLLQYCVNNGISSLSFSNFLILKT